MDWQTVALIAVILFSAPLWGPVLLVLIFLMGAGLFMVCMVACLSVAELWERWKK